MTDSLAGLDFNTAATAQPATPALAIALAYAKSGLPVFPCNPLNKRPLIETGFKAATTDAFKIRSWWAQHPNAMIGCPTGAASGFWVFDIDTDPAKGKKGLQSIGEMGRDLSELMDTAVNRTATGGYHCLFKFDPAKPITNARGALKPHLDVRGEGGYVIMAGSRLADGRAYEWLNPPDENEITEAPDWLLEAIQGTSKPADVLDFNTAAKITTPAARVSAIDVGTWHENTRDLVARMIREGSSDETIAAIAPRFTVPGYSDSQTVREFLSHARTARSKWGYQPREIAPQEAPEGEPRFRILSIDELANVAPPEWRIDGIFPTHGSSTIYGAYESFKTWVALDMLLSLAAGREWQGRASKACSVLYVAGEGQHGLAHRVLGWCSARNEGQRPQGFRALPEAVAIPHPGETDDLLRAIDALPEPPGVVAFDTITRMSGGGSLNDEKDMQAYVRGMDRVRLHTGGHVMNVGHAGKDNTKGLLGSIVLPAAMETIICVERRGDSLTLVNTNPKGKQKDGPNFEDIRLRTQKVTFERAAKSETTLVLMPDEDVVREKSEPARRLGPLQKQIMDVLEQAARDGQSLGFMRLKMMCGSDDGTLGRTLRNMVDRGTILQAGEEGNRQWMLP